MLLYIIKKKKYNNYMQKKFVLPNKYKKLITPVLYFVFITVFVINSITLFNNNYYTKIFIDGQSMAPTLNNSTKSSYENGVSVVENVEYGIVDSHDVTIKRAGRFDIITCFYPWSDYSGGKLNENADFKIKRIIATPGDTFKIDGQVVSYLNDGKWDSYDLGSDDAPFTINKSSNKYISQTTLGEDEYWVMGDNWGNSYDSSSVSSPIKYENITGVLIMIKGTCTVTKEGSNTTVNNYQKYSKPRLFF